MKESLATGMVLGVSGRYATEEQFTKESSKDKARIPQCAGLGGCQIHADIPRDSGDELNDVALAVLA